MNVLMEYECRVALDGYEVITFELPPGSPWTVLQPRSKQTRRFDLFEESSDAFLEFAQTELSEDGIKAFADHYGLLEGQDPLTLDPEWFANEGLKDLGLALDDTARPKPGQLQPHRDDLSWARDISDMYQAVKLWEMSVSTGDFSEIIRRVQNRHLSFWLSRLSRDGVSVELLLKKDPLSGSARLCIRPYSLLGALWAQFALAIDGGANLGACKQCGKWFMLEAGRGRSGRSDKEYCSDACRMRAYRKRKSSRQPAGARC
jgi:hypothetical protein